MAGTIQFLVGIEDDDAIHFCCSPDFSIGKLLDIIDSVIIELLLCDVNKTLVHLVEDVDAIARTHPNGAVAILEYAVDLITGNGVALGGGVTVIVGGVVVGVDDGETCTYMPNSDDSIAQVFHAPQLAVGHTFHRLMIVMGENARLCVEIFNAFPICGNPDVTICGC